MSEIQDDWSPCLTGHGLVHGARGKKYSHPLDDYNCVMDCFRAYVKRKYGIEVPFVAEDGPAFMEYVKLSREAFSPQPDNANDGCGYWECIAMIISERNRRKHEPTKA